MRFPLIVSLLTALLLGCAGFPPSRPTSAEELQSVDDNGAEQTDSASPEKSKEEAKPAADATPDTQSEGGDGPADRSSPSSEADIGPGPSAPTPGASAADELEGSEDGRQPPAPAKPMSLGQLADAVLQDVKPPYALVVSDGRPVLLTHDVDIDGMDDVCVLVVRTPQEAAEASRTVPLSEFSDFSRLYQGERDVYTTYLQVYRQAAGGLDLIDRIPLGEKVVFESFAKLMVRSGFKLPVAFSASFQTSAGQETEWAVYHTPWQYSRLTLRDDLRTSYYVEDINGDNVLDVVIQERGFEEGTGYETFLTWFRWNGERFEEHRFANVVRSIRRFLERSRELLIQEEWREFVEYAVAPDMLDPMAYRTESAVDIVTRAFRPVTPDPPPEPVFAENVDIVQVVFPNVMEDPFTPSDRGTAFPVPTRVVTRDGRTVLFKATIAMMQNPFVGRQYTFVLHNHEGGQIPRTR